MQCEFSKAELIRMDLAIMDRTVQAKASYLALQGAADKRLLQENIDQLEALHNKLDGLIKQASEETSQ